MGGAPRVNDHHPSASQAGGGVAGEGGDTPTNLHQLVNAMRQALAEGDRRTAYRFVRDLRRELTNLEAALQQQDDS